jgi:hypothetical protein
MRYFLDTEFNGFDGELISLALVPEYGDREYYVALPLPDIIHPWVERHVLPYLRSVPPGLDNQLDRLTAAHDIAEFLASDRDPMIVADWPDAAHRPGRHCRDRAAALRAATQPRLQHRDEQQSAP